MAGLDRNTFESDTPVLTDPAVIRNLLTDAGLWAKKRLGQNFLTNPAICPVMARSATEDARNVLEIGPGIGTLTVELAKYAEKVVAVELDEGLRPVLEKTLAGFTGTKVIFRDILRINPAEFLQAEFGGEPAAVCANLPYYITTPVLTRLLAVHYPISSLTVMVQKEAADRICAPLPSRLAGALTVFVGYRADAERLMCVNRESFLPAPNVDSAVIRLNIRKEPPVRVSDEALFARLVRAGFGERRKTLPNAAAGGGFPKETVRAALRAAGVSDTIRAEGMTMQNWADVANALAAEP